MFDNSLPHPHPQKIVQLENVEKCCRAGEITDSNTTWHMSFVCRIANATNTRSGYVTLTACQPQPCYVIDTAPVLLLRSETKCVYCAVRTVSLNIIQYIHSV